MDKEPSNLNKIVTILAAILNFKMAAIVNYNLAFWVKI